MRAGEKPCLSNSVACIGGLDWDETIRSREELIRGTSNPVATAKTPGGVAHNVAAGLANLGVEVSLYSIVGRDSAGDDLLCRLRSMAVESSGVTRSSESPTARYSAIMNATGELVYGLADMEIFSELDEDWCVAHEESLARHRVWVVDANLPARTLRRLLLDMKGSATILVDPVSVAKSSRLSGVLGGIDVLFPDRREASALSGLPADSIQQVEAVAARLHNLGSGRVVVSLGEEGVCVVDESSIVRKPAFPPEVIGDVTGAGDALLAGYAYGLLEDNGTDPVDYGLASASLVLESFGASVEKLTPEKLNERLSR